MSKKKSIFYAALVGLFLQSNLLLSLPGVAGQSGLPEAQNPETQKAFQNAIKKMQRTMQVMQKAMKNMPPEKVERMKALGQRKMESLMGAPDKALSEEETNEINQLSQELRQEMEKVKQEEGDPMPDAPIAPRPLPAPPKKPTVPIQPILPIKPKKPISSTDIVKQIQASLATIIDKTTRLEQKSKTIPEIRRLAEQEKPTLLNLKSLKNGFSKINNTLEICQEDIDKVENKKIWEALDKFAKILKENEPNIKSAGPNACKQDYYSMLKTNRYATKEQIEKAYNKILEENTKENIRNRIEEKYKAKEKVEKEKVEEEISRKIENFNTLKPTIKLAYETLTNEERRKAFDEKIVNIYITERKSRWALFQTTSFFKQNIQPLTKEIEEFVKNCEESIKKAQEVQKAEDTQRQEMLRGYSATKAKAATGSTTRRQQRYYPPQRRRGR